MAAPYTEADGAATSATMLSYMRAALGNFLFTLSQEDRSSMNPKRAAKRTVLAQRLAYDPEPFIAPWLRMGISQGAISNFSTDNSQYDTTCTQFADAMCGVSADEL